VDNFEEKKISHCREFKIDQGFLVRISCKFSRIGLHPYYRMKTEVLDRYLEETGGIPGGIAFFSINSQYREFL